MNENKKTKLVAFRIGIEEFAELEATAILEKKTPTEIARHFVREGLSGNTFIELARQEMRKGIREIEETVQQKMVEVGSKLKVNVDVSKLMLKPQ
jgi:hypothetical protein